MNYGRLRTPCFLSFSSLYVSIPLYSVLVHGLILKTQRRTGPINDAVQRLCRLQAILELIPKTISSFAWVKSFKRIQVDIWDRLDPCFLNLQRFLPRFLIPSVHFEM